MKPGDLVRLKSGGPVMTVTDADPKDEVGVTYWNAAASDYPTSSFPEECLELASSVEIADRDYGKVLDIICAWPHAVRAQLAAFIRDFNKEHDR